MLIRQFRLGKLPEQHFRSKRGSRPLYANRLVAELRRDQRERFESREIGR